MDYQVKLFKNSSEQGPNKVNTEKVTAPSTTVTTATAKPMTTTRPVQKRAAPPSPLEYLPPGMHGMGHRSEEAAITASTAMKVTNVVSSTAEVADNPPPRRISDTKRQPFRHDFLMMAIGYGKREPLGTKNSFKAELRLNPCLIKRKAEQKCKSAMILQRILNKNKNSKN